MNFLSNLFRRGPQAAALQSVPLPKAPKDQQTLPAYRTNTKNATAAVTRTDRQLANTDRLIPARNAATTPKVVRELSKSSPDLAGANGTLLRTGIPEEYTVVARDMDGKINVPATQLAQELLRRLTFLGNVDGSFGVQQGLQSLSEQLSLELLIEGAMCLEVALDKGRVPASFNVVGVSTLTFYEEDKGLRMVQKIGGEEIDLDLPTIIYVNLDQYVTEAYPSSYLESAIQPVLADVEFTDSSRKAMRRAVLPRLMGSIDSERVKKFTPPEILADAELFAQYKNALIAEIEDVVNGLNPEDALISFDTVDFSFIDGGKDPSTIIERVQKVLNSKLAAGAKTLPVVLGHGSNSNASSTEALLYLKHANLLRVKLNELYSRALTVAVRVMGQDCYVEFKYAPLDLRPVSELETFKAVKQARLLELLSLGLMTDEEACIELTGNLPPAGYKPLAGTMFKTGAVSASNPASNTAAEQSLTPDTPKGVKSQNNKAK